MYTTRRATIGHFLHHSGHGACDDGTRSCRLHGPVHEDTFEIQNVLFFKIFGTLNAKQGKRDWKNKKRLFFSIPQPLYYG
jgi:hypothetical protein